MALTDQELKKIKKLVDTEKEPKVSVISVETKFHYYEPDSSLLVELVSRPKIDNKYKYLVWDNDKKDFTIMVDFASLDGAKMIPPTKEEKFLKDILVPRIDDEEKFKSKIKNFNNKELDNKIDSFLKKWFVMPDEYFLALRLFIKFSWVHEQSYMKTYLSLWGDRGTGKTMVGIFLSWLCRFPYFNKSGVTPAVLARSLDLMRGIAIIDESDMYLSNTEETASFMRILRGYHADSSYDVVDEHRKSKFPRKFNIGFPKVILSAKPLKDDHLSSRCIILELKPAKIPIEMIRDTRSSFWFKLKKEAQEIVDELLVFRICRFFESDKIKTVIEGVEPRYNDVAMPLFYMIDEPIEQKMFYNFVVKNIDLDLEQRSEQEDGQILRSIKKLIENPVEMFKDNIPKVYIEDVVKIMREDYHSDENSRDVEKLVNYRRIGWKMKGLGIKTKREGAGRNKTLIDPGYLKNMEQLYSRFGIKDEIKEEIVEENITIDK